MARLDKTRARVLCDDYGLCGTQLAQVKQLRQGRTLELAWGWQRDEARVWRYSAKRAARTPPRRISGAHHAESVTFERLDDCPAFGNARLDLSGGCGHPNAATGDLGLTAAQLLVDECRRVTPRDGTTACPSAKADCGADSIDAKRAPRVPVNIERDVVPMEPAVHQRAGIDPAGRRGFV
jgi:hypothetical protein